MHDTAALLTAALLVLTPPEVGVSGIAVRIPRAGDVAPQWVSERSGTTSALLGTAEWRAANVSSADPPCQQQESE